MTIVLLSLLGTAFWGMVLYEYFDDDNENDAPPPGDSGNDTLPSEDEIGQMLGYEGSDLLEGTQGDDTLPAGQDETLAPDVISLLGGGDTATIEVNDTITVSGGNGDDSITATGVLNILEGGAGNDTLSADDSNRLFGGKGNDVLNFTHGSYDQGDLGIVNGGEGNDTINLRADALVTTDDLTNVGGVDIHGGDGADDINIIYDLKELDESQTPADNTLSRGFVSVSDFNPEEDSLVIEIERNRETEDRNVTVELDQTEDNGTYTSLIRLTFEETGEAEEASNILTVISNSAFSLEDIELIGATG